MTVPSDASVKDKLDYVGVELPWGWGNVLMGGAGSLGGVTLTGKDSAGKSLTVPAVEVDKASVSRRSCKVKVKATVDAATGDSTANYLV